MERIERTRREVAAGHARRAASPAALEFIKRMEVANAVLRLKVGTRAAFGREHAERWLNGRAIAAFVVACGLAWAFHWLNHTAEGQCARVGFQQGYTQASFTDAVTTDERGYCMNGGAGGQSTRAALVARVR